MSTAVDQKAYATKEDMIGLHEKIDGLFKRLDDKIDDKFTKLDNKIDAVENRLSKRLDDVENKFERNFLEIDSKLKELNFKVWVMWWAGGFIIGGILTILFR